jgi:hypothetical protein
MIRVVSQVFSRIWKRLNALATRCDRTPPLLLIRTEGLPERLSPAHLYVVGERGEDWFAAMSCPCGCGAKIDLNLVPPGRPCWALTVHVDGSPTLSPSVWRRDDCGAHFFVRRGRIVWARESQGARSRHPITPDSTMSPQRAKNRGDKGRLH